MENLWPQQVGEEKQVAEHKLCRDISRLCRDKANNKARNFFMTNPDYVATKLEDKLCRDKAKDKLCYNKVLDKLCHNKVYFVATKFYFDATKFTLWQQSFTLLQQSFIMSRHYAGHPEC